MMNICVLQCARDQTWVVLITWFNFPGRAGSSEMQTQHYFHSLELHHGQSCNLEMLQSSGQAPPQPLHPAPTDPLPHWLHRKPEFALVYQVPDNDILTKLMQICLCSTDFTWGKKNLCFGARMTFFYRENSHRNKLPRDMVESPLLEVFRM